jgi:hypothetical protein
VDLVAEVDLQRWSHAVYLLQKLFPHINQLSVQLPDASCATEQIQVSRTRRACRALEALLLGCRPLPTPVGALTCCASKSARPVTDAGVCCIVMCCVV